MIRAGDQKSNFKNFTIHNLEYSNINTETPKQVRFDITDKEANSNKKEQNNNFLLIALPEKYSDKSN